jgi:hypothetical protein
MAALRKDLETALRPRVIQKSRWQEQTEKTCLRSCQKSFTFVIGVPKVI